MAGQILMVLATQSHNIRAFFKSNEEPLLRLGLGTLSCYLGLLALSKSYEAKKLSDELAGQAIQFRATKEALTDEKWLQNATYLIIKAAQDGIKNDTLSTSRSLTGNKSTSELILENDNKQSTIASLALRKEIENAFITGERKGLQESRAREWMPELTLPRTDAVKEGRERRDALLLTSSTTKRQNDETSKTDTRPVESSVSLNNTEKISTTNTNTALAPIGFRRSGLI